MQLILNLTKLPELQRLDRERRRSVVIEWWIELWKSWPIFLADFGLGCCTLSAVEWMTTSITDVSLLRFLVRGALIIPAFCFVSIVRNHLIFIPRSAALKRILERPEFRA
jgi:hypothetical protein